jgi:hypothetical protein
MMPTGSMRRVRTLTPTEDASNRMSGCCAKNVTIMSPGWEVPAWRATESMAAWWVSTIPRRAR